IFVEGVRTAAFKRERADYILFVNERDGDLGALPLAFPFVRDVIIGVAQHVADDLRAAFADGAPDHSVRNLRAIGAFLFLRAVTFLDVPDELFARFLYQSDEQEFVIDYPVEQRGDVIEQPVEVQDRSDLVTDFNQRPHLARALAQFVINAGVFERDRQMIAEHVQYPLVIASEIVRLRAFYRQHPDDPVLARERERDGDLRKRQSPSLDRDRQGAGIARHVADVDRGAFAPCRGGDAAVERDDLVRSHVFRVVADSLLPRQTAPRFINQKEVEELVVDHFPDAMSHAVDQLVEVENGYEFDAQLVDQGLKALRRLRRGRRRLVCGEIG